MACSKNVRWYIESLDGTNVLTFSSPVGFHWMRKEFGGTPKIFKSLREARKRCKITGGTIRHYKPPERYVKDYIPF